MVISPPGPAVPVGSNVTMFVAMAGAAQSASPMPRIIKYCFMPLLCPFGIFSSIRSRSLFRACAHGPQEQCSFQLDGSNQIPSLHRTPVIDFADRKGIRQFGGLGLRVLSS